MLDLLQMRGVEVLAGVRVEQAVELLGRRGALPRGTGRGQTRVGGVQVGLGGVQGLLGFLEGLGGGFLVRLRLLVRGLGRLQLRLRGLELGVRLILRDVGLVERRLGIPQRGVVLERVLVCLLGSIVGSLLLGNVGLGLLERILRGSSLRLGVGGLFGGRVGGRLRLCLRLLGGREVRLRGRQRRVLGGLVALGLLVGGIGAGDLVRGGIVCGLRGIQLRLRGVARGLGLVPLRVQRGSRLPGRREVSAGLLLCGLGRIQRSLGAVILRLRRLQLGIRGGLASASAFSALARRVFAAASALSAATLPL